MLIIPGIDCFDEQTATDHINAAAGFSEWIHIDIADGKFTPIKTWGTPQEFSIFSSQFSKISFEIHLMANDPEKVVEDWLKAGAKRIIVHLEALKDPGLVAELCKKYGAESMISILPTTPIGKILPYVKYFDYVQLLTVSPGLPGQKFGGDTVNRINFLKENVPGVRIEIDGGINPETARLVKDAGAEIAISTSYIFNSSNPRAAFDELNKS